MIGLMRVKNEARWIGRCVRSILPVCERVIVMDDHSTDGTPELCAAIPGVDVVASPYTGLDETRDKNWLLGHAKQAEWILMIDGDEMLEPTAVPAVEAAMHSSHRALDFRIIYLWDSETQIRMDGVYGRFRRPSMFRRDNNRFVSTAAGGFHCGNVPVALQSASHSLDASLLHFGYMHRADRLRKYEWYRSVDGSNQNEDGYRHMVVGDIFLASASFRWGGPLDLQPLAARL